VQEALDGARRIARPDDDAVGLVLALERVHRHRESALRGAGAPEPGHALELGERPCVERRKLLGTGDVACVLESADRLPDLPDRAPLEREALRLEHRLVSDVHGTKPGLSPERQQ